MKFIQKTAMLLVAITGLLFASTANAQVNDDPNAIGVMPSYVVCGPVGKMMSIITLERRMTLAFTYFGGFDVPSNQGVNYTIQGPGELYVNPKTREFIITVTLVHRSNPNRKMLCVVFEGHKFEIFKQKTGE